MADLIDPEPIVQQRLREELGPLREQLAAADGRWAKWRLRQRITRAERRVRRELGHAAW